MGAIGRGSVGIGAIAWALLAGAGCASWEPPVAPAARPGFAALKQRVPVPVDARLAVSVRATPAGTADPATRTAPMAPDARAEQAQVVAAVRALGLFKEVGGEDAAGSFRLTVSPRRADVSYVGMAGFWPANFALWSFIGPLSWFVADENFAGDVAWDVALHDPEGRELATTSLAQRVEKAANDFDRGFSVWDVIFYASAPIDEGRLARMGEKVLPYAEADTTYALCRWLVEDAQGKLPAAPSPEPEPEPEPKPVEPTPPTPVVVTPPAAGPRTFACCIGVSAYATDPAVPHAAADAEAVADALAAALGIERAAVGCLTDADATAAAVRAWCDARRADALRAEDRVVLFFAGRGATDAQAEPCLVCADGTAATPGDGTLRVRDLCTALKPARVTLLLDCAFQGRVAERGPGGDRAPRPPTEVLPGNADGLAAGWGGGEAATSAAQGHGLFTGTLLDVLGGVADQGKDGATSYAEAHAVVGPEVMRAARLHGIRQEPTLLGSDPALFLLPKR